MNKKLKSILFFTFFTCVLSANTIKIGDKVPNFVIPLVNNSGQFQEEQLVGKITIIEFWATWCSPCIGAMEHLAELQNQFPEELQVLAVSSESIKRVQHFVAQKEFAFNFAIDSSQMLNQFFPHRIIPHSILIDQQGVVRAITNPEEITSKSIQQLLALESINLLHKMEDTDFDYGADYFEADSNTLRSFVVQPFIPGVSTFSNHPTQGPFTDRRLSMHNFMIDGMYRTAYQVSDYRMIYEIDEAQFDYDNPAHKYCLDIIVAPAEKEQLYPILIQKLSATFSIKTRLDKKLMDVAAIYRLDSLSIKLPKGTGIKNMSARGDYYQDDHASFADVAEYLENYGIVGMVVVDESNDIEHYKIELKFSPEEKGSFQAALKKMGLGIKKAQRVIEVLVIYE